jgi:hypothetical protein
MSKPALHKAQGNALFDAGNAEAMPQTLGCCVWAELQIIQQQLTTSHNMTVHQRNELSRLEDRIARLEAHTRIEDSPQH